MNIDLDAGRTGQTYPLGHQLSDIGPIPRRSHGGVCKWDAEDNREGGGCQRTCRPLGRRAAFLN